MSIRKGKRYEREVARRLRELGWTVEQVTGSGGFSGTGDADLVMLPPNREPTGEVALADEPAVVTAEVKYSTDASGFTAVYDAHARLFGLELTRPLVWRGDILTTGLEGLTERHTGDVRSARRIDDAPAKVIGWLEGKAGRGAPDVVLCRGARRRIAARPFERHGMTTDNNPQQLEATA